MGKNQAYKAMQRARVGSSSAGPEVVEDGMMYVFSLSIVFLGTFCSGTFLRGKSQVDGSFHSPEWHAARLASLKMSHTITWEEYKRKQKEDEMRKGELEADTDRMMREYRAQLDAERALKLSQGRNHKNKKDKKDKDTKKSSSKKRKRSRRRSSESSSSSSSSESSSSDDEERESKRSRSRHKKSKKEKKHRSSKTKQLRREEEAEGPVPLSRFFGSSKR